MCRNHLSFIKDHLSLLLTLFGLLQPVIFGRLECDKNLVLLSFAASIKSILSVSAACGCTC